MGHDGGVDIDISLSDVPVTATATLLPLPVQLSAPVMPHLRLRIDKTSLFGFMPVRYEVECDASGTVTSLTGLSLLPATPCDPSVFERALGAEGTTWNSSVGSASIAYTFGGRAHEATLSLSHAASMYPSPTRFSSHILLVAATALNLSPDALPQARFVDASSHAVGSVSQTIEASVAGALSSVLSTQASQDALFQSYLGSNGPLGIATESGTNDIVLGSDSVDFGMLFRLDGMSIGVCLSFGRVSPLVLSGVHVLVSVA
jgi:hypothetical protein